MNALKITSYTPMTSGDFYRHRKQPYTGPDLPGYSVTIENFECWINKINFDRNLVDLSVEIPGTVETRPDNPEQGEPIETVTKPRKKMK